MEVRFEDISAPLAEVARKLRVKSSLTNAYEFMIYANRLSEYPQELGQSIDHISMRGSETYPTDFFDNQLSVLQNYFVELTTRLTNLQSKVNDGHLNDICVAYVDLSNQLENENAIDRNLKYLGAIVESGLVQDSVLPTYFEANNLFEEFQLRQTSLDMMLMSYFMDTTSIEISQSLAMDIDTIIDLLPRCLTSLFPVYQTATDFSFEPLVAVASIEYPQELESGEFMAHIDIENFGPATSDSISLNIILPPNLNITSVNGVASNFPIKYSGLALNDVHSIEVLFEVVDQNKPLQAFLEIDGDRTLSSFLTFDFFNVFQVSSLFEPTPLSRKPIVNLYPNPTNNFLHIEEQADQKASSFDICNLFGRVIMKNVNQPIDIRSLSPGVYFLRQLIDGTYYYHQWVKL